MNAHIFSEEPRNTPVAGEYDVLVAGGGPSGVAAALAAARLGAKTRLIERAGCLGGVWTSGLLSWVLDSENKTGLMKEIRESLAERGAAQFKSRGFAYDPEEMKLLIERLCLDAGVDIRLHTLVCGAIRDQTGRLTGLITESKSGREAWRAPVLIDATGDGDLGALAGCTFDLGRPETGETQPMTLIALLCGVHPDAIRPFIGGGIKEAKKALFSEFTRAGVTPSYSSPTLFHIRDDLYALSANHEYGVSAVSAEDITKATLHARAELHRLVSALKQLGNPWTGLRLIATAPYIGIREGRRLRGMYTVTIEDMAAGVRHDDAVCSCTFGVDVHSTNHQESSSYSTENNLKVNAYDIPLRALISSEVGGLLFAGRCISGDFLAHSSYRVTGNAVALGEAAGKLAAISCKLKKCPGQVTWSEFRAVGSGLNEA